MSDIASGGAPRRRGFLLLAAMFLAGGLAGAAIDRVYVVRQRNIEANNAVATLSARRERERRLSDREVEIPFALAKLNLTQEQEEQIRRIVIRIRPRTDSLWNAVRPRAQALESQMFQESLCVLTREQIDHYKDNQRTENFPPAVTAERLRLVTTGSCPKAAP